MKNENYFAYICGLVLQNFNILRIVLESNMEYK